MTQLIENRTIDIVFYHDIENVRKNQMQDNKNDVMHNVRQEQIFMVWNLFFI